MTKVEETPAKKISRDVAIALKHMNKRRELTDQIEALDAAILALE